MSRLTSREIGSASRPSGSRPPPTFAGMDESEPLKDREVLVRNLFMSVDPYMRGRMNAGKSYVPPFELANLSMAAQSAMSSNRAPGNSSRVMWSRPTSAGGNFVATPEDLHPVSRQIQPLSVHLGALGMTA